MLEFQRIEDRVVNFVQVHIITESGCDPHEKEYTLLLTGFIGTFNLLVGGGGMDDVSLIQECIDENLDFDKLPKEGATEIILEETGEWEDVFWNKYYKIVRVCVLG